MAYTFTYTVGTVEYWLQSEPQLQKHLVDVTLPPGNPGTFVVQLAVVVRDALGASVRCSTGLEPGVLVQVLSSLSVVDDPVTYAGSLVDSLLYNNLNESKAGVVLANLGLLSQFLSTSTDPCSAVACGSFGACFLGVCTCNSGSGYTGPVCSVAPVPVHGLLGLWVAVGSCSVSCGGGW